MKRVVFLDYDGVVNNKLWGEYIDYFGNKAFNYGWAHPEDNFVNNFQAVCWLNRLYEDYKYDIVVTSTWRLYDNYKECLYNGGLNKDIKIIDKLPSGADREDLIKEWLDSNDIDDFIILDDEEYYYDFDLDPYKFISNNNLIMVNPNIGINESIYHEMRLHFSDIPWEI